MISWKFKVRDVATVTLSFVRLYLNMRRFRISIFSLIDMFLTSIDIISNSINNVLQSSLLYSYVFILRFTFIRATNLIIAHFRWHNFL